ncbi:stage II sporulation protein M [Evansella cellulosilytica]|uniref:Stage II sporulation protein M n=1 Tax=Evansella cellulosilytica (strain ATCC 21833 / DSM 2522 / FERM P-1141 / JCM 9156 / N-4) TaxID=649639 RepID=E6TYJ6_EVAC2|nr:stage II sporulation protein M [Evansella cellulosilytica]ADU30046.1 stage II sporulation protein M [Evansella cellulosilytica DSM 2522]
MKRIGGLKIAIINFIEENKSIYMFTVVLLFMGVVFGAIIVNSLSFNQKNDLYAYLTLFFGQVDQGEFASSTEMFAQTFSHYIKYLGLMWLLGLTVIGLPINYILLFIKGIVVGFTVGFLVNQMGFDGFLLAFVSVLPQNILLIPIYVTVATVATVFSIRIWRQISRRGYEPIFQYFVQYAIFFVFICILIAIVSFYEAYASPPIIRTVLSWIS